MQSSSFQSTDADSPFTETKQKTLEELDYVFAVPTSKFAAYQIREALPYWFKRWVLFQKNARLRPLYQEERHGRPDTKDSGAERVSE